MKSVRGLSVMWGVDSDGGDWPFFVKAPEFSRKDVIASIPSLVPRRSMFFGSSISIPRRLRRTGGIWPEE